MVDLEELAKLTSKTPMFSSKCCSTILSVPVVPVKTVSKKMHLDKRVNHCEAFFTDVLYFEEKLAMENWGFFVELLTLVS